MFRIDYKTRLEVDVRFDWDGCPELDEFDLTVAKYMFAGILRFKMRDGNFFCRTHIAVKKLADRLAMDEQDVIRAVGNTLEKLSELQVSMFVMNDEEGREMPMRMALVKDYQLNGFSFTVYFTGFVFYNIERILGLLLLQLDTVRRKRLRK